MKTIIRGPKYVIPKPPKPYYSCEDCSFYSCTKVRRSGARPGTKVKYDKKCKHPTRKDI